MRPFYYISQLLSRMQSCEKVTADCQNIFFWSLYISEAADVREGLVKRRLTQLVVSMLLQNRIKSSSEEQNNLFLVLQG